MKTNLREIILTFAMYCTTYLRKKNYPVTLEDFPEIRGSSATEKLCNDFFLQVIVHKYPCSKHS